MFFEANVSAGTSCVQSFLWRRKLLGRADNRSDLRQAGVDGEAVPVARLMLEIKHRDFERVIESDERAFQSKVQIAGEQNQKIEKNFYCLYCKDLA